VTSATETGGCQQTWRPPVIPARLADLMRREYDLLNAGRFGPIVWDTLFVFGRDSECRATPSVLLAPARPPLAKPRSSRLGVAKALEPAESSGGQRRLLMTEEAESSGNVVCCPEAGIVYLPGNTICLLAGILDESDGTRTRDLRRDRPVMALAG